MDADQVPEGEGAPGLLDEHPGPHFGDLVSSPALTAALDRFVRGGAQGPQSDGGGAVVEKPDHQEQQRPAGYARQPENPLDSKLAEGRPNQDEQKYYACPLEGPNNPHGDAQVSPEPQGNTRYRQYREYGGGDAQEDTKEEVELPQVGHNPGGQHAGNEEQGSQQQELAHSVPVS